MSQRITVQDGDFEVAVNNGSVLTWDSTGVLSISDSTDTDSVTFSHDGTDLNITHVNTTDWNITGITAIQAGTVDADFDAITATSYDGIVESDLLDKSATETVGGTWTFSTIISGSIDGNAATATTATGATNLDISASTSTDATAYLVLVGEASTGNQLPFIDNENLSYNASTNALTATTFVGALTGIASGNVTDVTGGTGVASSGGTTPSISLTVDELAEKSGALAGTDRLVGTTSTTNWAETISGIPLSIFNDDLGHVENATHTGQVTGATSLSLAVTAITDQPASGAIVAADTILINDGGTLSEATFTQMDTYFNSSLSFGSGTVTSSGTPLNNEVAVFATGTDINSDSTFTWDGTNLSATQFGGINEGDLLDKSATETITGAWNLATPIQILGDINTATPPTTETITNQLLFRDLADNDTIGTLGFEATNDLNLRNVMREGTIVITTVDTGGTERQTLSGDPDGETRLTGATSVRIRPDAGTAEGIFIGSGSGITFYHNNVAAASTIVASAGGFQIDNDLTSGVAGQERVLTVADLEAGQPRLRYAFSTTITATDPGAGLIQYDSATPASVTTIYINDASINQLNSDRVLNNLANGDILSIVQENDNADYLVVSVNGTTTDEDGWWTIPVTVIHSGTLPSNTGRVNIDIQWFSKAVGGGNVSNTGTPVNNQLAIWTNATTVEGDPDLLWDATNFDIRNAGVLRLFNSGSTASFTQTMGTNTLTIAGTGLTFIQTSGVDYIGRAGGQFTAYEAADTEFILIKHDGTDGSITVSGSSGLFMDAKLTVEAQNAATTTDIPTLRLRGESTGTPAAGIGTSIEFETETAIGAPGNLEIGGVIATEATDVTGADEDFDFVFSTMVGGNAAAERMRITSAGNITATSFGGITESNLVDRTAATTITGLYTHTDSIDMGDEEIIAPTLRDFSITHSTGTISSNAVTLSFLVAQSWFVDLAPATDDVTITLFANPPSGSYGEMTIRVKQDSGTARTITWVFSGGTFVWDGSSQIVLTSTLEAIDIFHFHTIDGGTTWYGTRLGTNFA